MHRHHAKLMDAHTPTNLIRAVDSNVVNVPNSSARSSVECLLKETLQYACAKFELDKFLPDPSATRKRLAEEAQARLRVRTS